VQSVQRLLEKLGVILVNLDSWILACAFTNKSALAKWVVPRRTFVRWKLNFPRVQADEVDALLQLLARQVVGFEAACGEQIETVEALYNEVRCWANLGEGGGGGSSNLCLR